ncbi:MAG: hypothetical protein K0U98_11680 [Deltaproteobacteria bacterium]|nr:hypothetical protein [Deltaproteobacteria bacterium]
MTGASIDRSWSCRFGALSVCLVTLIGALIGGIPARLEAEEKPAEVSWESLRFRASKFGISATSAVDRSLVPGEVRNLPKDSGQKWKVAIATRYVGRSSNQEIFFGEDGKVLVTTSWRASGTSSYRNERVYGLDGVKRHRQSPKTKDESKKPWSAWTETSSWTEPYPEGFQDCQGISDPGVLLHFLSSPNLQLLEGLCFFSKKALWRIAVTDLGSETMQVEYTDRRQGKAVPIRKAVEARKISVQPALLHGDPDSEFRLLGLEGDLTVQLHPAGGFPLRLAGRMPKLGKVTVFLETVE